MITAGLDAGNNCTKAVIVRDGKIAARGLVFSGFDQKKAADDAYAQALQGAGLIREDVAFLMATGTGKAEVAFADGSITDIGASARGAVYLFPEARTVADVGAEEGRVLKVDARGKVVDFAISEKCAAGTGSFVETMSRALEIPLEEIGPLSLQSNKAVPMSAQCAVFAESEVVSLIHAQTPKADIARAIHDALASRISSMVRRVGLQKEMVLIGGLARNPGFVRSLEEDLDLSLLLPRDPEYVSALGAALAAVGQAGQSGETKIT